MKKSICLIICLIMILALCACGDSKASIVTLSGENKKLSAKEVYDLYNSNQMSFAENYAGAEISLTATVVNVKEDKYWFDSNKKNSPLCVVTLEDGWKCEFLMEGSKKELAKSLKKGDKIQISSKLWINFLRQPKLSDIDESSYIHWNGNTITQIEDHTEITIIS